jgi:DNA repair exonuclease SbcCD ATPase subunit
MTKAFVTAAIAALCLGVAACASQKEPAEQALAALETKFLAAAAEIRKYLPERHAELEASVASLRDAMAQEDYGDVVKGAAAAQESLKRAIADSRVARAQMLAAMDTEWTELTQSMPKMIDAMDKKITSQRGRPPKGMTSDAWKQTIAEYDAARDTWSKAVAEMSRATFEQSVLAARDAKARIEAIMATLEVKAS